MVQAIINLNEHDTRVLNVVKGKYGLSNKSAAVSMVIQKFESEFLEPDLRPEFIEEMKQIEKGKFYRYKTVAELRKKLEDV